MTKVIKCNGINCEELLPDGDRAVIAMKWSRREQFGLDGTLHPNPKAKYEYHFCSHECARRWTDAEIERIAQAEHDERTRRAQLRASDMDGDDDELFDGAEAEEEAEGLIEVPYREPMALAAGAES